MSPYLPHKRCVFEFSPQHLQKTVTLSSGVPDPPRSSPSLSTDQSCTRPHHPAPTLTPVLFHNITPNNFFFLTPALSNNNTWNKKTEKKVTSCIHVEKLWCCASSQEFLKKEFSEENILFWQACEYFSHVPATDKKQVSPQCEATDEVGAFVWCFQIIQWLSNRKALVPASAIHTDFSKHDRGFWLKWATYGVTCVSPEGDIPVNKHLYLKLASCLPSSLTPNFLFRLYSPSPLFRPGSQLNSVLFFLVFRAFLMQMVLHINNNNINNRIYRVVCCQHSSRSVCRLCV